MSDLFTVVCLLVFTHRIYGSQVASCNFADSPRLCEWHTDNDFTVRWIRTDDVFWNFDDSDSRVSGYHMELNMDDQPVNATGRLLSPNITGSINQTCQLRMVYAVEDHTACQLSVWLRAGTNLTSLPATLMDTYQFDKSPYISVPCIADTYQIIIEGKKISEGSCGSVYDKIGIASIEYFINRTTGEGSMSSDGDVDNKETQSNLEGQNSHAQGGGADEPLPSVSKWAFAFIAIAVYTAILIVCVVLFCLLRKFICRRRGSASNEKREQVVCSFSNTKLNSPHGADSALTDANPYSMPDEKQEKGQTTGSFHASTDTASPYAVGGTAPGAYEEAVKARPPLPLAASGSPEYNRLGEQPTFRVRPKIYDHANDTTGAYSTTNMVSRQQDQQREMAAVQYSHLQRNQEYV